MNNSARVYLAVSAALSLFAAAFLTYSETRAFSWDESYHLLASQLINTGRRPYLDFCFPQAPLNAYWDAVWMRVLGQSWRVTHALAAVLTLGAVLMTAEFTYRRFPVRNWRWAAAISAAMIAGLNPLLFRYGSLALGYGMCLFALAAALQLCTRAVDRRAPLCAGVAGLCAGAAAGSSLLAGAAAPVLLGWMLFYNRAGSRSKKLLAFILGAAIPFAPVLWLFWQGPRQTWFNLIEYHLFFRRLYWPDPTLHDLEVLTSPIDSGPALLIVFLSVLGLIVVARSMWAPARKAEFYLCAWVTSALSIEAATTHPTFVRYFVLSIPFVALLGAAGIYSLAGRPSLWPCVALGALLTIGLGRSLYSRRSENDWRNYEQRAEKVDSVTPRGALLLADEPIYFLTRRTPPPGFELYYSHKVDLPPADRAILHLVSEAEVTREEASGIFSTVYTCDEDDADTLMNYYRKRLDINGCMVFWDVKKTDLEK